MEKLSEFSSFCPPKQKGIPRKRQHLGKYGIFKPLQAELMLKKFSKVFLVPCWMLLVQSTLRFIRWELYVEVYTFWRKCGDKVSFFSISWDGSLTEEKQTNLDKNMGISIQGSSHMIGSFHWSWHATGNLCENTYTIH